MIENLVTNGANLVAGVIIIGAFIFLVPLVIQMAKGQGSILKIVGIVFSVIAILGSIYALTNYKSIGENFSGVAEQAIEGTADEANDLF